MDAPIWLSDAPEIRALLGAVLDRFDRQSGHDRARNIAVGIERFVPALARNDGNADQMWALLRDLERAGVLTIRAAPRNPYDPPWSDAKAVFSALSEATLRHWLQRPAAPGVMQQWRAAVARRAAAFADAGAVLSSRRITIAGRTNDEVVAALASLATVARPATLRQLSAAAFWGDSKVLDDRGDLIVSLFPHLELCERAIIVAAHLPMHIQGVLFIENQDTYVAAMNDRFAQAGDHALVYLSGFKATAARIRSSAGAAIHCGGPGVERHAADFRSWWFMSRMERWPLFFWGDLDFAGLQILKALRSRFEGVAAWRPGYEPMLQRMNGGNAHSHSTDSGQIDPGSTGCDYADQVLLPAIRARGFCDQESVELDASQPQPAHR